MQFFVLSGICLAISFTFLGCIPEEPTPSTPAVVSSWRTGGIDPEGYDEKGCKDGLDRAGLSCADVAEFVAKKITYAAHEKLQTNVATLEKSLDDEKVRLTGEKEVVQDELDRANLELQGKLTAVNDLENRFALLEGEKGLVDGALAQLTTDKSAVDRELAQLKIDKTAVDHRLAQLTTDKSAVDRELAQLKIDKTAVDHRLAQLTTDKSAVDGELAQLKIDKTAVDHRLTQLTTDKSAVDRELAQLKIDKTAVDHRLTQLTTDKGAVDRELAQLKTDKTAVDDRLAQLNTDKGAVDRELAQLKTDKTAVDDRLAQLTTDKGAVDRELAQLKTDKTAVDDRLAQLTNDKETVENKKLELEQALATAKVNLEAATNENLAFKAQKVVADRNSDLTTKLDQANEDLLAAKMKASFAEQEVQNIVEGASMAANSLSVVIQRDLALTALLESKNIVSLVEKLCAYIKDKMDHSTVHFHSLPEPIVLAEAKTAEPAKKKRRKKKKERTTSSPTAIPPLPTGSSNNLSPANLPSFATKQKDQPPSSPAVPPFFSPSDP